MKLIKTAVTGIAFGVAALAVTAVSAPALAVTAPVETVAMTKPINVAASPRLSSDIGCADMQQRGKDGKMRSACTAIHDGTPPEQRKDIRDCAVGGGLSAAGASPGGPVAAGGAGVAGCAAAVYSNHSKVR